MNKDCEPEARKHKGTRKAKKPININREELPLSAPVLIQVVPDEELTSPPTGPTKEDIAEFRERVKKANATRKIKKFMKKHQQKRTAHFLKAICSDADVCMAFGTEADKIKKYFDDFNNFDLLSKPAKQIGSESANGFVKDLTYEKNGYVANAILKSSTSDSADNLLYEGLVGQFLNKQGKRFPCFLETYGIYQYKPNEPAYIEMKTHRLSDPVVLKLGLKKLQRVHPVHLEFACEYSRYMAVLIQHLNNAQTFKDLLSDNLFINQDLLNVLYQVYMPLAHLAKNFTHFDLHYSNVLLYEPIRGKYIQYHYHTGESTITSFKCRYIAKIIDYGRCFFNDDENLGFTGNSKGIYTEVCFANKCEDCGLNVGFDMLVPKTKPQLEKASFIYSQEANQSHDLRLLYMTLCDMKLTRRTDAAGPLIIEALEKVVYGKGITLTKQQKDLLKVLPNKWVYYGTKENKTSGLPKKVNNVTDAYKELERLVSIIGFKNANEYYYRSLNKLGDLHIYDNGRPMRYVPA
jgi:thiamine kinase-like enzyme